MCSQCSHGSTYQRCYWYSTVISNTRQDCLIPGWHQYSAILMSTYLPPFTILSFYLMASLYGNTFHVIGCCAGKPSSPLNPLHKGSVTKNFEESLLLDTFFNNWGASGMIILNDHVAWLYLVTTSLICNIWFESLNLTQRQIIANPIRIQ